MPDNDNTTFFLQLMYADGTRVTVNTSDLTKLVKFTKSLNDVGVDAHLSVSNSGDDALKTIELLDMLQKPGSQVSFRHKTSTEADVTVKEGLDENCPD